MRLKSSKIFFNTQASQIMCYWSLKILKTVKKILE